MSVLSVVIGLGLTACSPVYHTNYSYVSPKSWRGRQCVNRCLRDRSQCHSRCRNANQRCHNDAELAAMPAYLEYLRHQRKQNLPATQSVSDFANYASCSDYCGCEDTYRQCFTNCGGDVIANTKCVAFCKKPKA